uniref:BPTI/Kunitz inhibitor domain-containing protein n=1 Tax=Gopherus agassizii TaxID=38772 RepID=A0A452H2P3_9SAUR
SMAQFLRGVNSLECPPNPGSCIPICKLPGDAGSCFSYMTRYFYNSVTASCEEFVYGGCEGNGNRFATKNECLKTCGSPGKRARATQLVGL